MSIDYEPSAKEFVERLKDPGSVTIRMRGESPAVLAFARELESRGARGEVRVTYGGCTVEGLLESCESYVLENQASLVASVLVLPPPARGEG
jgi:hypothetical protein